MRMSAEISALYKKHDIKMGRAMLLPFLSLPIMIAMWQAVQRIPSVYEATFLGLSMGSHPMDMIKTGNYEYILLVVVLLLVVVGTTVLPALGNAKKSGFATTTLP